MVFFHIITQVCRSQLCVNQSLPHNINYVKKNIYSSEHIYRKAYRILCGKTDTNTITEE